MDGNKYLDPSLPEYDRLRELGYVCKCTDYMNNFLGVYCEHCESYCERFPYNE